MPLIIPLRYRYISITKIAEIYIFTLTYTSPVEGEGKKGVQECTQPSTGLSGTITGIDGLKKLCNRKEHER
jgi:hypothetical protein